MAIYFQGFGEKGHLFSGIWGESITFWGCREQGAEEKHFRELGRKVIFLSGSKDTPPPPLGVPLLRPSQLFSAMSGPLSAQRTHHSGPSCRPRTFRFGVQHSTTRPPRSIQLMCIVTRNVWATKLMLLKQG